MALIVVACIVTGTVIGMPIAWAVSQAIDRL